MKRIFSTVTICLIALVHSNAFAQITNMGKEFWVGYGHHQSMVTPPYNNDQSMVLYFITGDSAATVTVRLEGSGNVIPPPAGGPWTRVYVIPPHTSVSIEDAMPAGVSVTKSPTCIQAIGPIPKGGPADCGFDARLIDVAPSLGGTGGEKVFQKRGIHIISTTPIVAYAHIYGSASAGATMLLPVDVWGYDYTSVNSQQQNADNSFSWLFVIADHDHTKIEINPAVQSSLGKPAGVPFIIRLNKGEIFQLLGAMTSTTNGSQLTGTTIKSIDNDSGIRYPIAMFSGSSRTSGEAPCADGGRDNDIQQVFPQESWGQNYLTGPLSVSGNPASFMNNVYKVVIKTPGTIVKRNGVPLTGLISGKYYKFQSNAADYIEATQPVMVAQFMGGVMVYAIQVWVTPIWYI